MGHPEEIFNEVVFSQLKQADAEKWNVNIVVRWRPPSNVG